MPAAASAACRAGEIGKEVVCCCLIVLLVGHGFLLVGRCWRLVVLLPVLRRGAAQLESRRNPAGRSKDRADRLELRRRRKRQTKQRKQAGSIKEGRPSGDPAICDLNHHQRPRHQGAPGPVGVYWANAADPLATTGTRRESLHGRPDPSSAWRICARPRSHHPAAASTSSHPRAAAPRARRRRSARTPQRSGPARSCCAASIGRSRAAEVTPRAASVVRARCSALFAAATDAQQLGDLRRLPAQHLTQDQDRALARREVLQRSDERQPDTLTLSGQLGGITLRRQDRAVGDRLDPWLLPAARPAAPRRARPGRDRPGGRRRCRPRSIVKADAGRDHLQATPAASRGSRQTGRSRPRRAAASPARRLRLERRPQHPVAVPGQLAAVLRQPRTPAQAYALGAACGARLHHRRVSHPRPFPTHAPLQSMPQVIALAPSAILMIARNLMWRQVRSTTGPGRRWRRRAYP